MSTERVRPLGEIIRTQRRLARMSLRQLAAMSSVSNPYLSQIERGIHEPSFRVLQAVADALDTSTEVLMREAGMLRGDARSPGDAESGEAGDAGDASTVESAIAADDRLSPDQKAALVAVYRSYVRGSADDEGPPPGRDVLDRS